MRLIFILYFCSFCVQLSIAQSPYIRQYTDRDGLPGMIVYQVLQDDNGFIWIATDNGVCYFDGRSFKLVEHPTMQDLDFIGLRQSPDGRIWFWNWSGQVFYMNKNRVEHYSPNVFLDDYIVRGVYFDVEGNKWLIRSKLHNGYLYCDNEGNCSEQKHMNAHAAFNFMDKLGKGVTKKSQFFWHYNLSNLKTQPSRKQDIGRGFLGYNQKYGKLYIEQGKNILYNIGLDSNQFTLTEILRVPKERVLRDVYEDYEGNTWVFTDSYIYLYDSKHQVSPMNIPYIENRVVNTLIQDKDYGYWVGTKGEGLIYIASKDLINYNISNSNLKNDNIVSVAKTKEGIIAGSATGSIIEVNDQGNIVRQINIGRDISFLKKRVSEDGYFLISKKGLLFLNPSLNIVNQFVDWGSTKALEEHNDSIFLVTNIGVSTIFKDQYGKFPPTSVRQNHSNIEQLCNNNTTFQPYCIAKQEHRKLIGTIKGLVQVESKSNECKPINFTDKPDINNAWIRDIQVDKQSIWLSTNIGLLELRDDTLYQQFSVENGLSSNNCNFTKIDKDKLIWVGTHKGINILNPKTKDIHVISLSDGLPSNRITSLVLTDSLVWLGTPSGLVYFHKKKLLTQKKIKPIVITNFKIDNQDTLVADTYHLNYENNDIVIEFVSPIFEAEQALTYYYRLKGFKDNWLTTQANTIPFTNLPAGRYQFEIYAMDELGQTSPINDTLTITISKPFWQQWWFLLTSILVGAGIVAFITNRINRVYRLRRERNLDFQRELSESKIRALQSQMNPHFIFNALNAIQHFFTIDAKELAMQHLNKFAQLIRLIFEYSKETTISLYKEVNFIKLYLELEKLRFGKKITIDYHIDENIKLDQVYIPPLLIQPLIENAFKHGLLHKEGHGNLKVIFSQENPKKIRCIVEDDGVGREKAKKLGKSWRVKGQRSSGLTTVKERVDLFNQNNDAIKLEFSVTDLKDEQENALGTRVDFYIHTYRLNDNI